MKLTILSLAAALVVSLGSVASAQYRDAVQALTPDHYWYLDETDSGGESGGATAVDSGNATTKIDGTYAGFYLEGEGVAGAPGPDDVLDVNIADGNLGFFANDIASVDLGPGTALANTTMTYAGWFTESGSQGGDRLWTNNQSDGNVSFQIFFGGANGPTGAAHIGIGLNPAVNGFPAEGLPSGDTVGNFHIEGIQFGNGVDEGTIKDGQWHHIVASRNGNNIDDVIVVIDGVNFGSETWSDSTDTWGTTGTNAQIATRTAGDGGGSKHALNGSTDEVAIWLGRQLTVEESIALYNAAVTADVTGDFTGDGDVDGDDFLEWQRSDGTPGGLSDWQGAYPTAAASAAASVPEPATLTLMALFGVSLATMRRRA